jgi:predicted PurR-regulated permease PerM
MTDSNKWLLLAVLFVVAWVIYLLAPVLTPFVAAALLAYLGDPTVDWLESHGIGRTWAVVIVFAFLSLVITLALIIVIPKLGEQIGSLARQLPELLAWAETKVRPLLAYIPGAEENFENPGNLAAILMKHLQEAGNIVATILGSLSRSGATVVGWLVNLFLIPVVTFYLLRDWDALVKNVRDMIPRNIEPVVVQLSIESDVVLGAFVRGQLTVMFALGVIYVTGLWLVGVDLALLIGMVAGVISFVPYLGTIIGVAAGVIAAMFQFSDSLHVFLVLIVFVVGQLLEGTVLTPLLVGDRIGLHPVAVIFAILAGGQLFGFVGILLALPVASVVMVLLRHVHELYRGSELYGEENIEPEQDSSPEVGPA